MLASVITKTLAAASANNIAASQSLAGAGYLTINGSAASGGVATLDSGRQIIITSAGNDGALTWTVIGTDETGNPIKDIFPGANGVAASNLMNFLTVTSIYGSGATASTVTVGTNGVGSSAWKSFGSTIETPNISFNAEILSGAVNYSVQFTQDKFLVPIPHGGGTTPAILYAPANPNVTAHDFTSPNLSGLAASAQGSASFAVQGWRLKINSGTGQIRVTGRQAGLASP